MLRGPVLVGTDLSPAADEALRQGARLATELASKLFVCHVVPELIPDGSVFTEFRRANVNVEDSVVAKARAAVEQQVNTVRRVDDTWLCASAHNTDVVPGMETNVINDDGTFRAANYQRGHVS